MALGATFPLAVRVAVSSHMRPGGPAGRLYGANTAGAAAGALVAGFFLIPILGLTRTTITGMAASAASIALALYIARHDLDDGMRADIVSRSSQQDIRRKRHKLKAGRISANSEEKDTERPYGLAATTLALTGFVTFVHEVAWTRVLAMVVGPSIYA